MKGTNEEKRGKNKDAMIHREDPFVATFCLNLIEMESVTTSVVRLFDRYVFQRNGKILPPDSHNLMIKNTFILSVELGALMCERCIFTTKSRKACLIHQKTLHEPEFRSMVSLLLEPDGLPIEPPVVPIEPDAEISEHDAVLDEAMKSIREVRRTTPDFFRYFFCFS